MLTSSQQEDMEGKKQFGGPQGSQLLGESKYFLTHCSDPGEAVGQPMSRLGRPSDRISTSCLSYGDSFKICPQMLITSRLFLKV